jgi:hypothetical protein
MSPINTKIHQNRSVDAELEYTYTAYTYTHKPCSRLFVKTVYIYFIT